MNVVRVKNVVWNTNGTVVVEMAGGKIAFDSDTSSFKDFDAIKNEMVVHIEAESDGGRKFIKVYL